MRTTFALLICVCLCGCVDAKKATLREGMYQGSTTAWNDAQKWGQALVVYPVGTTDPRTGQPSDGKNQAGSISLSPLAYDELLKTRAEYEALVAEDRARDAQGLFGASTTQPSK